MVHLTPKETAQFLQDHPSALFVDCRSEMEFRFVGHPIGAAHVPWKDGPGWEVNLNFVAAIGKLADGDHDRPAVLICRSGERAVEAAKALETAGHLRVYAVRNGFEGDVGENRQRGSVNGWRVDGLPWETSACGKCG